MTSDEAILQEAREAFDRAREGWADNQREAREDLEFARLGRQWDERIKRQRELEQRPCLTFNKMPAFIRQVVNDARQNKPAIKVHPRGVELLLKYLAYESTAHPLRYMSAWLREQVAKP